jgi:hypothetical protein
VDRRLRNILVVASVSLALFFLVFQATGRHHTTRTALAPPSTTPDASTTPSAPSGAGLERSDDWYSYALDLLEVDGRPPDLEPGTPVEIWVSWSDGGRVSQPERWIRKAVFRRIAPSVTSMGPDVVVLDIPAGERAKMIWADGYGAVTLIAEDH